MIIAHKAHEVRLQIKKWRTKGESVALVPTMGNLHAGHLSLVQKAAEIANHVVISIFVNPLQFNDVNDYSAYPRTLDKDIEKLKATSSELLFAPAENELYPEGRETITQVNEPALSSILEGTHRPNHFVGVTTVVAKLLNIVTPDYAVFGEKDYQQLQIVQKMVRDLNLSVDIVGMPTTRELDGLAMSSRNSQLKPAQRQQAVLVYQVLTDTRAQIIKGSVDYTQLEQNALQKLDENGFKTDYVAIRSLNNLLETRSVDPLIILVAARLDGTRLIDNLRV